MFFYLVAVGVLLSWANPLHFPPWVSWHSEVLTFSGIVLFAWRGVLDAAKNGLASTVIFPLSTVPIVAMAIVVWLQCASGVITFGGDALVITFYFFGCIASLALGRVYGGEVTSFVLLAKTLLLGSFLSAIVAFSQVFDLWEGVAWINRMPQLRRPGGNLGQPNQLATLLLMGMASLLFLYESKKLSVLPSALLALTLLIGLAATESRTGVLSFSILLFWWFAKRKSLGLHMSPRVAVITGAGFLCLFWTWPALMDAVWQATGVGIGSEVNTSVGTRWLVWPQLMEAVLQRPWWGWGLGQVPTALNAVVHSYASSENFTYAHNIVLDLALGMGLPIAAIAVMLAAIWLWRRVCAVAQLASWYCLALVLPVAVHSMLEFPFAYAYLLFPVTFALGALDGLTGAKSVFRLGVKPVAAVLLLMTVVMAWSVVEYLMIEEDFRVLRFEALRIGKTPENYQRPHVTLLTQLDALLNGGRIVPKPDMTDAELDLARKVALRFPWPATQNRYALSLALNGSPAEAIRQIQVMRVLHGDQNYSQIRDNWVGLAAEKYPQLNALLADIEK